MFSELLAHKQLALILTISSVVMFVGSLLAVPWLIGRAPRDFFTREEEVRGALPLRLLRNLVGVLLVAVGVALLVLPGQGILTLLVGLALLDIPGKRALLVRMAKREKVMRALNYFRKKRRCEPFDAPE